MPQIPFPTGDEFFPGMGSSYYVGLKNVGVHVIDTTLSIGTFKTNAEIVAAPPNACWGPVIHSLGVVPTAVIPIVKGLAATGTSIYPQLTFVTADNSAVYVRAKTWTGAPAEFVSVQLIVIR